MRGNMETYAESCSHKLVHRSLGSKQLSMDVYFSFEMLISFLFALIISISIKDNSKSIEHVVNFLKLLLRVLKKVLKNQTNLIFKNRLKYLKRKCFSVLRQRLACSHEVRNGSKNLQRFSFKPLKPFCLSSALKKLLNLRSY